MAMRDFICADCGSACRGGPNARRCKPCATAHRAAYRSRPEYKARQAAYQAAYSASPKAKAARKACRARPEYKGAQAAYRAAYQTSPKGRSSQAAYRARPEVKAYFAAYRANPEYKGAQAARQAAWEESSRGKAARARIAAKRLAASGRQLFPGSLAERHGTATEAFYAARPEGMAVDHIVPLNGRNVSGLHVPWNFQYLTKTQNSAKGNRMPPLSMQRRHTD